MINSTWKFYIESPSCSAVPSAANTQFAKCIGPNSLFSFVGIVRATFHWSQMMGNICFGVRTFLLGHNHNARKQVDQSALKSYHVQDDSFIRKQNLLNTGIGWQVKHRLVGWQVSSLNNLFNNYLLSTVHQGLSQVLVCDGQPKAYPNKV